MEPIDLELLQSAPVLHIQAVLKTRNVPVKHNHDHNSSTSIFTPAEMARFLYEPQDLIKVLEGLDELELRVMKELVACGGRVNSRDLAFYFSTIAHIFEPPTSSTTSTPPTHNSDALSSAHDHQKSSMLGVTPSSHLLSLSTPGLPPQYPAPHPHGTFEQVVRHLLLLGLLFWGKQTAFAGRDYTSGIHDGLLIVPEAVKAVVRERWGTGEPFATFINQQATDDPMQNEEGTEGMLALQRGLYLYWSLVASQRDGLALVNTGLLSRASLRQVIEQVGHKEASSVQTGQRSLSEQVRTESDAPYLFFLRRLLMQLGLLKERNGAIYAVDAEPFFTLPLLERARRCYDLWQNNPFWNEMLYLPDVNIRPGSSPLDPAHEEVLRGRVAVVERIEHEQLHTWHSLTTFIARTKLYVPYLLFPRHYGSRTERYMSGSNPYGWDFRLKRGWLTHREGWHMIEGGFIRAVLTGPLHWLGITELDTEETPSQFRLLFGAALLLSEAPSARPITPGRLIVQPNFEIVVLAPVSEALLIALDRFADRISLEHIAQYRMTKASVTRAIQIGLHAEDIQQTLEQAAGGEIPQNIHYSLMEWERQARRIEVWPDATLLEVDDATILDTLFADDETRPLLYRRIAPRLAEIAPEHLETLQALLWQRDFLPPVISMPSHDLVHEQPALREAQWQLHSDGLLQPFYTVTDLYLAAEVERFSDLDQATGWRRITQASLLRALQNGLALDTIINFLNYYCSDSKQSDHRGAPSSFLIRLKLWGNGYGQQQSIAIEHAPMLKLSPEILADLLTDSEIASLLNGEVEQQQRLVRVHPDSLERVIALLQERGFSLENL